MDKTIVTALLVMAGVISAVTFFNAIYPTIGQSGEAIVGMQERYTERLKTQVQFIYGARSGDQVQLWVKNIGSVRVPAPESSDLFFGPDGSFMRVPFGSGTPHWEYAIENDADWDPSRTLRITIFGYAPLDPGLYYAKLVLPNGEAGEYLLSW